MIAKRTAAAICALLVSIATTSTAQDDEARAASLARDAEKLMADGNIAEACGKLRESVELDPRSATALDLGVCREKEGKLGSAYRAYGQAAELAAKEKRDDRKQSASGKKNKLIFRIAKLTVVVPDAVKVDGLTIRVNGDLMASDEWGKEWPSDDGDLNVVASAPGYDNWETTVKMAARGKKTVTVEALAKAAAPPPPPPGEPVPPPPPAGEEPEPSEEPEPDEPRAPRTEHDDGRIVVEVGALGGLLITDIARASPNELNGASYDYRSSNQTFTRATCGDEASIPGAGDCVALLGTEFGGIVGGDVFVGYALTPDVHLGGRGLLAARLPDGFFLVGGPALSIRATGPLWLGVGFLVGGAENIAGLEGARGSVPEGARPLNDNSDEVDVPPSSLGFTEANVSSGLLLGGNLELSIAIVGDSPHALVPTDSGIDFFSGSLMLGLWPAAFGTLEGGLLFAAPGGIAYRFH